MKSLQSWAVDEKALHQLRQAGKTTNTREIVRVALLSLVLAVLLQIPLSGFLFRFALNRPATSPAGQDISSLFGMHKLHDTALASFAEPATSTCQKSVLQGSKSVVTKQRAFQPTSTPHHAFVKFSSYRVSLNTIYVVGISSHVVRQWDHWNVVHTCEWHPSNGSEPMVVYTDPAHFIATNATMIYVQFDENGMTYVPATVNCTFNQNVGEDGRGGLLVLQVSLTYHRWDKSVPTVVMEERSGDIEYLVNPPKQKPFKYAFCGPPMHGTVPAAWIRAWLIYHNYILGGEAHFFFYNVGGLNDKDRALFKDFLDAGILSIEDLTSPDIHSDFPMWYFHQLLYINDCLHRSRPIADYAFFTDFDEYLQVRLPDTIEGLLERNKDTPWITFGSIPADFHHCREASGAEVKVFPAERMLWHDKYPECGHANEDPWTCVAAQGRRKYVANTRLVHAGGVHKAALPMEGGININASEARMIHFHGALSPHNLVCDQPVAAKDYESIGHMERDEAISNTFAKAKQFPIKPKNVNLLHHKFS